MGFVTGGRGVKVVCMYAAFQFRQHALQFPAFVSLNLSKSILLKFADIPTNSLQCIAPVKSVIENECAKNAGLSCIVSKLASASCEFGDKMQVASAASYRVAARKQLMLMAIGLIATGAEEVESLRTPNVLTKTRRITGLSIPKLLLL